MVDAWNAAVLNEAVNNGSIGGGGEGATTLSGLTDVHLSTPIEGDLLSYDEVSGKWVNSPAPTTNIQHITVSGTTSTSGNITFPTDFSGIPLIAIPDEVSTMCMIATNSSGKYQVHFESNSGTIVSEQSISATVYYF